MEIEKKLKKEKNTSFMKNVLMLMCSQVLIKVLGLLYKLVIINADGFGDVGNGYYSAGYQLYALLLTLSSIGVPNVVSKLVSEKIAIGDNKGADKIFKTAMLLFTTIGGIFSLALFFGADYIATNILNVPDVKYVFMVLSPAIVLVSASAVFRGYFSGLGSMKATSFSQTIEQLFNCVLSITFVYALIGKEPAVMAAGGNLSTTLAVFVAFNYLLIYYRRRRKGIKAEYKNSTVDTLQDKSLKQIMKIILAISIPITFGSIVSVINSSIDTVTITNCIQKAYEGLIVGKEALEAEAMRLAGILSKVETLIHLPLAINSAFYIALVPTISGAMAKKDFKTASKRLSFSFLASIIIIVPCAVGFIVLAEPILKMLYPAASEGAMILQFTTIIMIFVALNNIVNGGLYGLGKIHIPAISLVVGGIFKLVLNLLLISNPNINIFGATISSIVCQGVAFLITFLVLIKNIKLDIKFKNHILKPVIAGAIMGGAVFLIYNLLHMFFGNTISTTLCIIVGAVVYIISVFMLKILSKEEIFMMPYGQKIYKFLLKIKVYKEIEE